MLRWINFLRDILPTLTKLSKLTQRDSFTIVDLKKGVTSTLRFLGELEDEKGEQEKAWIKQVYETNEGNLCWPGKDGYLLRSLRSKRRLLTVGELAAEQRAFEESRHQYIKAIIDNIKMRFTDLTNQLQDFLVLHSTDQKGGRAIDVFDERNKHAWVYFQVSPIAMENMGTHTQEKSNFR